MKNTNYSHYYVDFENGHNDLCLAASKFISYIYGQFPNKRNNYVFFWQAINEDAYKNICKISKSLSLNMYSNKTKSKSDYCLIIGSFPGLDIIKMILKSHSLNTHFISSNGPMKLDYYINSTKNPIVDSNRLFDSYDYSIYIDLDWSVNLTFNNEFISNNEVLHILRNYMKMNNENLKIRERL
ncbi:hypothetical protein KQ51_01167 [Candidatus Izimaplasma bacterium HR1]|jgi:hypothetical protein|uniref:hypothetical protein n=1 Tax=Candidatus Izimoplasma sp. HR1 TaxID=1541959 RepID=UPI0004F61E16|nr:hypothetical protein KQ51_01167 [Candidatus Izimaplasma bacterium HR1]